MSETNSIFRYLNTKYTSLGDDDDREEILLNLLNDLGPNELKSGLSKFALLSLDEDIIQEHMGGNKWVSNVILDLVKINKTLSDELVELLSKENRVTNDHFKMEQILRTKVADLDHRRGVLEHSVAQLSVKEELMMKTLEQLQRKISLAKDHLINAGVIDRR